MPTEEAFKSIPLSKNLFAIVDCKFHDILKKYKWFLKRSWRANYYAIRNSEKYFKKLGGRHMIKMHHCVIGYPIRGLEVDHINGNGLDNRLSNLRLVSHQENMLNMKKRSKTTSNIKGVTFDKSRGKWVSLTMLDGKNKFLGRYDNKTDAEKAYNNFHKNRLEAIHGK